jgi:hypothetical protein
MKRILILVIAFGGFFATRALATPIEWQWTGTGTTTKVVGGPTAGTVTFRLAFDSDAPNLVGAGDALDPDHYGFYGTGAWVLDFFDGTSHAIWSGPDYLGVNLDIGEQLVPAEDWFVVRGLSIDGPGKPSKLWLPFTFPNPNSSLLPTSPPDSGFGWINTLFAPGIGEAALINFSLANPEVVPEPASLLLLLTGVAFVGQRLRRTVRRTE